MKQRHILPLLTLAIALATLPALGDLNYLKRGYKYIEKIPVKSVNSSFNTSRIGNLTDDNNATEWTSWEEYVTTYPAEEAGYTDVIGEATNDISFNELGFKNGKLNYVRYPGGDVANIGKRVITADQELTLTQGVTYQVIANVVSSKAGEVSMELGGQTATVNVSGSGQEEEVMFEFAPISESIQNASFRIDADLYSGSLDIKSVKLVSPKPLASTYKNEWNISSLGNKIDGTPMVVEGNLVANQARHFNIINGLTINKEHSYKISLKIKGDGPAVYQNGKVIVNLGTWGNGNQGANSKYLELTNSWQELSVEFNPEDLNYDLTDWASIYCWDNNNGNPKAYKGEIKVDWVEVYDMTDDVLVKREDYSSSPAMSVWANMPRPTFMDSEESTGNMLFVDTPPFHFKVLGGLTIDPTQTYTVRLKIKGNRQGEQAYVNLGDYGNGNTYRKIIDLTTEFIEQILTFEPETFVTIPPYGFCSIYCPNSNGEITVESVELYGGTQETDLSFQNNHLDAVGGADWTQFTIASGFELLPNKSYCVKVKLKGSTEALVNMVVGSANQWGWSEQKEFMIPSKWEESSVIFGTADMPAVQKLQVVRLQVGGYVGKIEIEYVKIYAVADDAVATYADGDQTKELACQLNDASIGGTGYTTPYGDASKITANSEVVTPKFYVLKDMDLPAGSYKLDMTYGAQANGTIKYTFGNPNNPITGQFDFGGSYSSDIKDQAIGTINAPEGQTLKGDLIFEVADRSGNAFTGNFDLRSIKITAGNQAVADKWNYEKKLEFEFYAMSHKPEMANDMMIYEPGWKRFKVLDNLTLKQGNRYKLIMRLKATETGTVKVRMGGIEQDLNLTGGEDYYEFALNFNFKDKPTGQFCEIYRPDGYNGSLYIDYAGFEETVSLGKDFDDEGFSNLQGFSETIADTNISEDVLEVTTRSTAYEVALMSGVNGLEDQTSYGVTARAVYTGTPTFKLRFGTQTNIENAASVSVVSSNEGLTEADIRTVFTREQLSELASQPDNYVVLAVSGHENDETLQVKSVRMWKPTEEFRGNTSDPAKNENLREAWNAYTASRTPRINYNGEELAAETGGVWTQFMVNDNVSLVPGKKYTLKAMIKGTEPGQRFNAKLGSWSLATETRDISLPTDWEEVEIGFEPLPLTNGMVIFNVGDGFEGQLQMKDMTLVFDDSENEIDFKNVTANPYPTVGNQYYPAPPVAQAGISDKETEQRLTIRPYYLPFKVTRQLDFNPRYNYTVTATVNVATGGNMAVALANDEFSEEITTTLNAGSNSLELGPFPAVTATDGYLVFRPMANLGKVEVSGVTIRYDLPVVTDQPLSSDYFNVELSAPLVRDGLYSFHIGYGVDAANNPLPETPTRFIVQGQKSDGKYVNLGQYSITPNAADADKRGHMYMDTYDTPLSVPEDGIIMLRFICTDNYGNITGLVRDGDEYATGRLIRMNRFAVYKQSEFLATETAATDNWVVPVITRFQIEAMGQQYAYPGVRLRDMIGIGKTVDLAGELFDGDFQDSTNPTYWDTTLPYNKEEGVAAEGGLNRDYDADGIDTPYDYIDLLLPDFTNKVKKVNGIMSDANDAKNQVVVVMKRGKNKIVPNDLREYKDLNANHPFIDKGNGFPLEIMYQGFKKNGTGKTTIDLDENVRVLNFPNIEKDDSIRFALDFNNDWDGIRIICRENTGQTGRFYGTKNINREFTPPSKNYKTNFDNIVATDSTPGSRILRLSEICAYMEIPKVDLESESGRADFAKLYNHRENFENYGWEHTRGILADINNPNYMSKSWEEVLGNDTYKAYFNEMGLSYPDFSYLNDPYDDEDVVPSSGLGKEAWPTRQGPRQRTYTVLHEVYALPGERLDLYPYSDIWNYQTGFNYEDQFVRWYDYMTDKTPDYLYFFSEPKSVIKTPIGFIGGKTLLDHGYRGKGSVASVYFQTSDPNSDWSYMDGANRKMKDQWVAADFSLTFNEKLAQRLGKDATSWASEKTPLPNLS